jgi:hypothetical protein
MHSSFLFPFVMTDVIWLVVNSGLKKDLTHIQAPDRPRVDCLGFSCSAPGGNVSNCRNLDYDAAIFDMYRLFYGLVPDYSKTDWSDEVVQALELLRAKPEMSFPDLARAFVSLQVMETGLDLTGLDVEQQLMMLYGFGPITTEEHCFVCCCNAYVEPAQQLLQDVNYTNAERGVCPHARERPSFCLSGPKIAQQCIDEDDCIGSVPEGMLGGSCGYDPDIVICMLSDQGWLCWDVAARGNLAIKVDFIDPSSYRFLKIPAASGTMVSQGNLQEITSLGVQVFSISSPIESGGWMILQYTIFILL